MRDIGLDVSAPKEACNDPKCPFHGSLPVRGQVLDGVVVSDKMLATVVVMREFEKKVAKYERKEKKRSKVHAHNPPCLAAKAGERVKIAECRPLGKTKAYVVVEVLK